MGHETPAHDREGQAAEAGPASHPARRPPSTELPRAIGNRAFARAVLARDPLLDFAPARQSSLARGGMAVIGGQGVWVTGPGAEHPPPDNAFPVISPLEYFNRRTLWESLERGTGRIAIRAASPGGAAVPGFRERILAALGVLMTGPAGRRLLYELNFGAYPVTIQPSAAPVQAGAVSRADVGHLPRGTRGPHLYQGGGRPGAGAGSTIVVDPTITDDTVVVSGASGELEDPLFIILGHELIHARHNAQGRAETATAALDPHDDTAEEERTIDRARPTAPGELAEITENTLRAEHLLDPRHGHGARDRRFRP